MDIKTSFELLKSSLTIALLDFIEFHLHNATRKLRAHESDFADKGGTPQASGLLFAIIQDTADYFRRAGEIEDNLFRHIEFEAEPVFKHIEGIKQRLLNLRNAFYLEGKNLVGWPLDLGRYAVTLGAFRSLLETSLKDTLEFRTKTVEQLKAFDMNRLNHS